MSLTKTDTLSIAGLTPYSICTDGTYLYIAGSVSTSICIKAIAISTLTESGSVARTKSQLGLSNMYLDAINSCNYGALVDNATNGGPSIHAWVHGYDGYNYTNSQLCTTWNAGSFVHGGFGEYMYTQQAAYNCGREHALLHKSVASTSATDFYLDSNVYAGAAYGYGMALSKFGGIYDGEAGTYDITATDGELFYAGSTTTGSNLAIFNLSAKTATSAQLVTKATIALKGIKALGAYKSGSTYLVFISTASAVYGYYSTDTTTWTSMGSIAGAYTSVVPFTDAAWPSSVFWAATNDTALSIYRSNLLHTKNIQFIETTAISASPISCDKHEITFSGGKLYLLGDADTVAEYTPSLAEASLTLTGPSETTVRVGGTAVFTVTVATGDGPFGYQWQRDTGGGYANVSGATSSTLSLSSVTLAMDGYDYRCVVTDIRSNPVNSSSANLEVIAVTVVDPQPVSLTLHRAGETACYSVGATGTSLAYQWYGIAGGVTGAISGATGISYCFIPTMNDDNNGYFISVTDALATEFSDIGTIALYDFTQVNDQYYYSGNTVTFQSGYTGNAGITLQWQKDV